MVDKITRIPTRRQLLVEDEIQTARKFGFATVEAYVKHMNKKYYTRLQMYDMLYGEPFRGGVIVKRRENTPRFGGMV